jgi:hypothetical protein
MPRGGGRCPLRPVLNQGLKVSNISRRGGPGSFIRLAADEQHRDAERRQIAREGDTLSPAT